MTYTVTLNRTVGADGEVTFTGTVKLSVTRVPAAGVTVHLGGIASLQGKTVTTDANGNFTYTTTLNQDGSDTGTAEAWVEDANGDTDSNVATVEVEPG